MILSVINDLHIGAIRTGGTTPDTAWQLRQDLLYGLKQILGDVHGDLLVNGDLFDTGNIPMHDLGEAVRIFSGWLHADTEHRLILARGNHDITKNSTVLSSFDFFGQLLLDLFGKNRVCVITELTAVPVGSLNICVLPHVANQDLFDMELAKVPECDYLFVHCNYDNGFAAQSDHSLNMSEQQAIDCKAKTIVFGHEHQAGTHLNGKVVIVGNQLPSSVSDCLGNSEKYGLQLETDDHGNCFMQKVVTWKAEGDFSEQDWRDLIDTGRFIRVTGEATAAEADKVVDAIARFRRAAKALVITNAVKIEGVDNGAELALTHEEVTNFNVLEALMEMLEPDEAAKVKKLLEEDHA